MIVLGAAALVYGAGDHFLMVVEGGTAVIGLPAAGVSFMPGRCEVLSDCPS